MADRAKPGWYAPDSDSEWLRWWTGKAWEDAFWPTRVPRRTYLPDVPRADLSTSGEPQFDIVGENWRSAEILAAINQTATPVDMEFEGYGIAELVPEPDNPHDRNAVSVRIAGYNVGYLPAQYAADYRPLVGQCVTSGVVPVVRVRIWGVTRFVRSRNREELKSSIRLALPSPDELLPANAPPPEPHFMIPAGRTIQVTGEDDHFDTLEPLLVPRPARWIATLHPIPGRAKNSTVLEVQIGGDRVGQLTPATSTQLLPLVRECENQGTGARSGDD